ncbi:GRAM domain-containing protein 4 [Pleurotus pulmonarius]
MTDTSANSQGSAVEENIAPLPVYEDLNEQQLREIYDNDEINRFLHIFSTSVTELHRLPSEQNSTKSGDHVSNSTRHEESETDHRVHSQASSGNTISSLPSSWVEPFLLPTAPPRPAFTLGRLKVAIQRLYLATVPVYGSFFSSLVELATWQDRRRSLAYCSVYWILWYHNVLLPVLFLRILFSLLRRRVLPYPTVKELRDHQAQVRRSYELGEEVHTRFSASSTIGLSEVRRIVKIMNSARKARFKKDNLPPSKQDGAVGDDESIAVDEVQVPDSTTVLDASILGDKTEANVKRDILYALDMTADIHERIRNIFIWRDPPSSRLYAIVIFGVFFVTLVLPAKYLAKLVYFILGVCFWHVMPLVSSFPPDALARLPPPLSDVPTDADYAMKLISQQALAGLRVTPTRPKSSSASSTPDTPAVGNDLTTRSVTDSAEGVNWKKWGEKLASSKAMVTNGRQILLEEHPSLVSRVSKLSTILAPGQASSEHITRSFPAYNISTPGLITITLSNVCFTPLLSAYATKTIPIESIRSVKKSGMLKGLAVSWVDTQEEDAPQEEKFRWVGGRDELFARLLGLASKEQRWRRA